MAEVTITSNLQVIKFLERFSLKKTRPIDARARIFGEIHKALESMSEEQKNAFDKLVGAIGCMVIENNDLQKWSDIRGYSKPERIRISKMLNAECHKATVEEDFERSLAYRLVWLSIVSSVTEEEKDHEHGQVVDNMIEGIVLDYKQKVGAS